MQEATAAGRFARAVHAVVLGAVVRSAQAVRAAVLATVVLIGACAVPEGLKDSSHFGWYVAIGLFCSPVLIGAALVYYLILEALRRLLRLRPATALGLELCLGLALPLAFVCWLVLRGGTDDWLGMIGRQGPLASLPIAVALWAGTLDRWRQAQAISAG
jgi:hypothetical protein